MTMRKLFFSLTLLCVCVLSLCSCQSGRDRAGRTAVEHLKMAADYPDKLIIEEVAQPDSAFGLYYLSQEDKRIMMNAMRQVSDTIMKRTHNMERFDPRDNEVMSLIDRQMRMNAEWRSALFSNIPKADFSGWKLHVTYRGITHQGQQFHALRWYFLDKEGRTVIKTVEQPLP